MNVHVISLSRAENDHAILQPSYSGSVAECCVLVVHAHSGLGWLCPWPHWSHMHHQLEKEWRVSHQLLLTITIKFCFLKLPRKLLINQDTTHMWPYCIWSLKVKSCSFCFSYKHRNCSFRPNDPSWLPEHGNNTHKIKQINSIYLNFIKISGTKVINKLSV